MEIKDTALSWFRPAGNNPEERKNNPTYHQIMRLLEWGLAQDEAYWDFGFPYLTQALPALRSGTAYTISPENVGKSIFLCNLGYGVLTNTEGAYWLDFTLDDSVEDRLGYLLARAGNLPINLIKQAGAASDEDKLTRKKAFRDFYLSHGGRYRVVGTSELGTPLFVEDDGKEEELRYSVEAVCEIVREVRSELGEEAKLLVTIDGFHDLDLENHSSDENQRLAQKSLALKRLATQTNSLIWMTAHTRKDSRRRGVTADVLKGEGRILYDAKVITQLYSDLNLNRDNATIFWEETTLAGGATKLPVLELDLSKNKAGSFKGILFYLSQPAKATIHEASEMDQEFYRGLLFSKN